MQTKAEERYTLEVEWWLLIVGSRGSINRKKHFTYGGSQGIVLGLCCRRAVTMALTVLLKITDRMCS